MYYGIINSVTKLHLVGYFYWVILRCTDPWTSNTTTPFALSSLRRLHERWATPIRFLLGYNLGFVEASIIRMSHWVSANQPSRCWQVETASVSYDRIVNHEVCKTGERERERERETESAIACLKKASHGENEWKRKCTAPWILNMGTTLRWIIRFTLRPLCLGIKKNKP